VLLLCSHPAITAQTPTLAALGITKRESSEAQKLAALPREAFEAVKAGKKTRTQVRREAQREAVAVWQAMEELKRGRGNKNPSDSDGISERRKRASLAVGLGVDTLSKAKQAMPSRSKQVRHRSGSRRGRVSNLFLQKLYR